MSVHHIVGSWEDRELLMMNIGPNNMLDLTILQQLRQIILIGQVVTPTSTLMLSLVILVMCRSFRYGYSLVIAHISQI